MEIHARSWSLLSLPFIAACIAGFCFNTDKDVFSVSLILGKDTLAVSRNMTVAAAGSEAMTFQFRMPKAKECEIDIYASEKPDDYNAFIHGRPLDSISSFQPGNTFAAVLNSQGALGHDLTVSRDGRRPYLFHGATSMSFHRMKSTHTDYIFYYDVNEIYYINYAKKMQRVVPLDQFQVDTLYVIMKFASKTDQWRTLGTSAFKMTMKE